VRCIEIWIDGIAVRKLSTIDKNANRGGAIRRIGEGYNRLRGLPDLRGANYYWQGLTVMGVCAAAQGAKNAATKSAKAR